MRPKIFVLLSLCVLLISLTVIAQERGAPANIVAAKEASHAGNKVRPRG